jgi:hypothetical protein
LTSRLAAIEAALTRQDAEQLVEGVSYEYLLRQRAGLLTPDERAANDRHVREFLLAHGVDEAELSDPTGQIEPADERPPGEKRAELLTIFSQCGMALADAERRLRELCPALADVPDEPDESDESDESDVPDESETETE